MPKLRPTVEQRETRNFNAFLLVYMKALKLHQEDIAVCLGITQGAVSNRLNEKTDWSLTEMAKICELLDMSYTINGN